MISYIKINTCTGSKIKALSTIFIPHITTMYILLGLCSYMHTNMKVLVIIIIIGAYETILKRTGETEDQKMNSGCPEHGWEYLRRVWITWRDLLSHWTSVGVTRQYWSENSHEANNNIYYLPHRVTLLAQIFQILSGHLTPSSIASGKSSRLHPVVNKFLLVGQHLHVCVKGSLGECHLWVRPYSSSSIAHVLLSYLDGFRDRR